MRPRKYNGDPNEHGDQDQTVSQPKGSTRWESPNIVTSLQPTVVTLLERRGTETTMVSNTLLMYFLRTKILFQMPEGEKEGSGSVILLRHPP